MREINNLITSGGEDANKESSGYPTTDEAKTKFKLIKNENYREAKKTQARQKIIINDLPPAA